MKWAEKERQIPYDITFMWNLKKSYKWTYLQQKQIHRHGKQTYDYQREKVRELGIDTYIHTTIYKTDNQQGPTV